MMSYPPQYPHTTSGGVYDPHITVQLTRIETRQEIFMEEWQRVGLAVEQIHRKVHEPQPSQWALPSPYLIVWIVIGLAGLAGHLELATIRDLAGALPQ
jgi:hypothetical protein